MPVWSVYLILYHSIEKIKALLIFGKILYFNKIQAVMILEVRW